MRIYKIRNFIVHSKQHDNDTLFFASQEQVREFSCEIPIIRSHSNQILLSTVN